LCSRGMCLKGKNRGICGKYKCWVINIFCFLGDVGCWLKGKIISDSLSTKIGNCFYFD